MPLRMHVPCLGLAMACLAFSVAGAEPALAPDEVVSRIAFGSCARQGLPQPIWEQIVAGRPQLFLLIGDNIYGDTLDMAELRRKYDMLAQVPGFRHLRETCPIWGTWDDHDYGANDAGAEYPAKVESQQIFLDFFGIGADSPRRRQTGVYSAQIVGPPGRRVQVILLDTRYFRSPLKKGPPSSTGKGYLPNDDPAATILGDEQWAWLAEQLRQPAELRIIASSIQVVSEDHSSEKWANFPRERQRLFDLIRETGAEGVLFLSGDRHLAELSMMDGGAGYPFYDLTSSGLTNGHKKWRSYEPNRHRVGTMNWGDNFGQIEIDWERPDPRIRLVVRDDEGEINIQRKIFLSTLRRGIIPGP